MKYMTIIGMAFGMALAFAIIIGGWSGFLWAVVLTAIGGIAGAHFEGLIDLRAIFDNVSSRRGGRG